MTGARGDILTTARLKLRRWRETDREAFFELNADPDVIEFLPRPLARTESDALLDRLELHFETRGFGLWAVETDGCPFIGFIGLSVPGFDAHFTPCVEVGWRLARRFWGHGYATEGGRAAIQFAFDSLGLSEVVSLTTIDNVRSRRVMERLGMTHDPSDDFEHPSLAPGHPLRPHVLYRGRRLRRTPQ